MENSVRILAKIKVKSKENKIIKIDDTHFVIHVKALPEKGKANEAVQKIISDYFNIPLECVNIVSGLTNKNKIIEIKL